MPVTDRLDCVLMVGSKIRNKSAVYFNQHMGAVYSNCWLKYAFSMFFEQKSWKKEEKVTDLMQNLAKNYFFKFAPERWWSDTNNSPFNYMHVPS